MKIFLLIKFDSSNYELEDFELNNFYLINKIGFTVTFFLATMIYWPLIYVVFTQSPKRMKFYSFITAYELTTSYIFTLLLFTAQCCFVFPFKGAYLTGFIQVGEAGNPLMFFSVILTIVFVCHSVATHLLYRLGSVYTSEQALSFFSHPKKLNSVLIPILILLLALTIVGFSMDQPEGQIFRSILISEHSYFEDFFEQHPYVMGYHEKFSSYIELLFLSLVIITVLAVPFFILIFNFFYRRLKVLQKNLSSSRKKWHAMFLKAILAQSLAVIIYLLIPMLIFSTSFLYPFPKSALIGSSMPLIASQYSIIAALTRVYFIKPYYTYFIKTFNNFIGKKLKNSSIVTKGF